MFTVQESIIAEYQRMLAGQIIRIPNSYFTEYSPGQKEQHALIVIRYALKTLLGLNGQQALQLFDAEMAQKLKIDGLIKYIQFPHGLPQSALFYVVFAAYPGEFLDREDKTVLHIYKSTLSKKRRVPSTFFDGEEGKRVAAICLNYQLGFIGMKTEELYALFADETAARKLLREYKLIRVLSKNFSTPLDYLHYTLPKKSDFWYNYYLFKKEYTQTKRKILKEQRECGKS